jgi:hypothetical protein
VLDQVVAGVEDAVALTATHLAAGGAELLCAQAEYGLALRALGQHGYRCPFLFVLLGSGNAHTARKSTTR